MLQILRFLLFPFALLYDLITRLRNFLYGKKIFKSVAFPLPVINIGNLTVGGTGKTPHVEYLVNLLKNKNIAILSRGYGRKTKGYFDTNAMPILEVSPQSIGDEPYQYFTKFLENKNVRVYIGEKRALATANILLSWLDKKIIILDDAFQHRAISPNINILLTDFGRLFYTDFLMPAGRLRESKNGAVRADAVIVSKCPSDFGENYFLEKKKEIISNIQKYTKENTPIFFSTIVYSDLKLVFSEQNTFFENLLTEKIKEKKSVKYYAVAGIAQPDIFLDYLEKTYNHKKINNVLFECVGKEIFTDHYHYTQTDFEKIAQNAKNKGSDLLITTEKDATKLQNQHLLTNLQTILLCKLPIEIIFFEKKSFDNFILNKISTFE